MKGITFPLIIFIIVVTVLLSYLFCIKNPKYYKRVRNTYLTIFAIFIILGAITFIQQARHMKERARTSAAKSNLHNMFVACQTYWKEKGSDKNCNLNTVTQKKYEFVQSKYVSIAGKGTAANFTAIAQHEKSSKVFTVNAQGKVTQVGSQ